MNGASMAYDKATASYAAFDGKPDLIRKNVNIQPTFVVPHGTTDYPSTLQPIYESLTAQFDALTDQYRKGATKLIHKGHQTTCFKLRLDRIRLLTSQLIHELGLAHTEFYKLTNQTGTITAPTTGPSDIALATIAVHRLWPRLDLQMLQYLDINRTQLIKNFTTAHNPGNYTSLSDDEQKTVDFVTTTILGYIKPATCLHHLQKLATTADTTVAAKMTARLDAKFAKQAHAEVDKAIDQARLPKDSKILNAAILQVIRSEHSRTQQLKQKKAPHTATKAKQTINKKSPKKGPSPHTNAKHQKPSPKGKGAQQVKPLSNPIQGILKKPTIVATTNKKRNNNNKHPTNAPPKQLKKKQQKKPHSNKR
jgi:hypothetical protein